MSVSEAETGWDRRRQALLTKYELVALRLFAELGFHQVTFEDIAAAADVSVRTLFRYFPAKEDILLGSPRRSIVSLVTALSSLDTCATPLQSVWQTVREVLVSGTANVDFMTLWRRAAADVPEVTAQARGERAQALIDTVIPYCARCHGWNPTTDPRPRLHAGIVAGAELSLVEAIGRTDLSFAEIFDSAEQVMQQLDAYARVH